MLEPVQNSLPSRRAEGRSLSSFLLALWMPHFASARFYWRSASPWKGGGWSAINLAELSDPWRTWRGCPALDRSRHPDPSPPPAASNDLAPRMAPLSQRCSNLPLRGGGRALYQIQEMVPSWIRRTRSWGQGRPGISLPGRWRASASRQRETPPWATTRVSRATPESHARTRT